MVVLQYTVQCPVCWTTDGYFFSPRKNSRPSTVSGVTLQLTMTVINCLTSYIEDGLAGRHKPRTGTQAAPSKKGTVSINILTVDQLLRNSLFSSCKMCNSNSIQKAELCVVYWALSWHFVQPLGAFNAGMFCKF